MIVILDKCAGCTGGTLQYRSGVRFSSLAGRLPNRAYQLPPGGSVRVLVLAAPAAVPGWVTVTAGTDWSFRTGVSSGCTGGAR